MRPRCERIFLRRSRAAALLCASVALALTAGMAQGAELHPHVGRLPGFPAIRGVVPVLGSSAAVSAREKLVTGAFAAVRARPFKGLKGSAVPNKELFAACAEEESFKATHDVCYRGGPVLHHPTVHLIFWQGKPGSVGETEVEKFPEGPGKSAEGPGSYINTVEQYMEDVAAESGALTNVFAAIPQYGEEVIPGKFVAGEYALSFNKSTDVTVDPTTFPAASSSQCSDEVPRYLKSPCLLDSDIKKEVEAVTKTSENGLHDIYVVMTPPGVGGCFEESSGQCAYKQYCAYHGDFGGNGVTVGQQTLYADIPFVGGVAGCDSGVHPNASTDNGADAAIGDASHEVGEVITDPIGSQCETGATNVNQCEHNAWTDVIGQEIADKCLPPESTVAGTYGEPLGGLGASTFYNQLINGDHYYTQRVWSNEAGVFEGGCVQRAIGASFSVSSGAAATVPVTFNGSSSGAPGDPATYWVWSFGEGEQVGTASPTISHTFAQPGEHAVGLSAYDAYGNAQGTVEVVNVGAAPPSPAPVPLTITIKEPASPPAHLTAAQLAVKLGLPANGKKFAGNGRIALGHAECPPACSVTLQLYAKVPTTAHGRRTTKLVPIATLHITMAAKGTGSLSLVLNAKGRTMLRKLHTLSCWLQVTVEGQEGGTWQIVRSLTLTSGGSTARHARR
jgi:PKD domain